MFLNTIRPAEGSTHTKRRVGRGIGSGLGKTGGRGHKGQKSRSGSFHKVGFEGGQMPLQRRIPKRGFKSLSSSVSTNIRLEELKCIAVDEIDLLALKKAGLISGHIVNVKVILSGSIDRAVNLKGIKVTKGAKVAIEAAGGKVEE